MPAYQKITARVIWQLAAPSSWAPASIIPTLFAAALAYGQTGSLAPDLFYLLLSAAVLIHSAVNALNDYYDFIRGTDRADNTPPDDDGVLMFHNYNPAQARLVGLSFFLLSLVLGAYIVLRTNYIPLWLGLVGALTVLSYSAGPRPLSYLPLGELVSGLVMGILLPMAVYGALTNQLLWRLFYYCLPLALGIALIMLTNNCCDIERDHQAGRRTLPILLGRSRSRLLLRGLLLLWLMLTAQILSGEFRGGLFILPLGLLGGCPSLWRLWRAQLKPTARGQHLGQIFLANLWLNGAYTIGVLASFLSV